MALEVNLVVKVATLLYLQDTACVFTVRNVGPMPVTMTVPAMDQSLPLLHVMNIRTGQEQVLRRPVAPKALKPEPGELPVGKSAQGSFDLSEFVPALDPGDYDVRITWEYNDGKERIQSPAVRITVLPATAKNLLTVPAIGGSGATRFASWVNLLSQPTPSIIRTLISLEPGRNVTVLGRVAECAASTRPVLSAPAVGEGLSSHWIAWVDGDRFKFLHDAADIGTSKMEAVKLPVGEVEIVEPLYSAAVESEGVRPPGAALLVSRGGDAGRFGLQVVELTPGRANVGRVAQIPGAKPVWTSAQFRTGGQKVVLFVQSDGTRSTLHTSLWPGMAGEAATVTKLVEWRGKFIAAGAFTDAKNMIRGGAIVLVDEKGALKPWLTEWSCSPFNEFKDGKRHLLEWPANMAITEASVAVNDSAKVAALLRNGEGGWHVFDGQKMQPVPPEFYQTQLPIQLGFLNGTGEPLLICGAVATSLKVVRLNGSSLPQRIEK